MSTDATRKTSEVTIKAPTVSEVKVVRPKLSQAVASAKKQAFECKHCKRSFTTRQGLGGHASKRHPGESDTYQAKVTRRAQRKNDRMVLGIAKQLLISINKGSIDDFTRKVFKRQRNRRPILEADPSPIHSTSE